MQVVFAGHVLPHAIEVAHVPLTHELERQSESCRTRWCRRNRASRPEARRSDPRCRCSTRSRRWRRRRRPCCSPARTPERRTSRSCTPPKRSRRSHRRRCRPRSSDRTPERRTFRSCTRPKRSRRSHRRRCRPRSSDRTPERRTSRSCTRPTHSPGRAASVAVAARGRAGRRGTDALVQTSDAQSVVAPQALPAAQVGAHAGAAQRAVRADTRRAVAVRTADVAVRAARTARRSGARAVRADTRRAGAGDSARVSVDARRATARRTRLGRRVRTRVRSRCARIGARVESRVGRGARFARRGVHARATLTSACCASGTFPRSVVASTPPPASGTVTSSPPASIGRDCSDAASPPSPSSVLPPVLPPHPAARATRSAGANQRPAANHQVERTRNVRCHRAPDGCLKWSATRRKWGRSATPKCRSRGSQSSSRLRAARSLRPERTHPYDVGARTTPLRGSQRPG